MQLKLWDQIVSWNNVQYSYKQTIKGAHKHKTKAIIFSFNETKNLKTIQQQVINNSYNFGKFNSFKVYEPKERQIDAPEYKDKIVHHMVYQVLRDFYEPKFIFDSFSCIRGKGNGRAVKRIQHFMRHSTKTMKNPYMVKVDVKKFFHSIPQNVLKRILKKKIKCTKTLSLCFQIIDSSPNSVGLPLGCVTSQLFANVLMNELDQFMKRKAKISYYLRYSDDIFFIVDGKENAKFYMKACRAFLRKYLKLDTRDKKCYYVPVSAGIDALGFKIFKNRISLKSEYKRKVRKKIKAFPKVIDDGGIIECQRKINSIFAHTSIADSENFLNQIKGQLKIVFGYETVTKIVPKNYLINS